MATNSGGTPFEGFGRAGAQEARRAMSLALVEKRAHLTPGMVGLPARAGRGRSQLSRSEVAALAGISVEHYIRIEQGISPGVTAETVKKICAALRMSQAEELEVLGFHSLWASPRRG